MSERIVIKPKASEFEAAVIGVVLDMIGEQERAAGRKTGPFRNGALPAWVRVTHPAGSGTPRDTVRPE